MKDAILDSLSRFSRAHVWVLGDCMLDEYVSGDVRRVSPEAPVPVLEVSSTFSRLGGAAHVAHAVAALGARVRLCGVIGKDPAGDDLLAHCQESGIDAENVVRSDDRPTTRKLRVLGQRQQLMRLDWEGTGACGDELGSSLVSALENGPPPTAIVVSDYAKGFVTPTLVHALVEAAANHGVPLVVDPKGPDWERYRGATVVKPNLAELEQAAGERLGGPPDTAAAGAARRLISQAGIGAALVTLGERGALLVQSEDTQNFPARPRQVYEGTGAGDAFAAVLALSLGAGASLENAARIANTAAGITVEEVGATVVRTDQLAAALQPGATPVLASPEDVAERVAEWRRQGHQVVFTNGCFDLLHPGHLSLLRQAAEFGDRLVVGINSDDSVRRLKGEGRPVVGEEERGALLAALDVVDAVVVFGEDTPRPLLARLKPDVLVKGADYRIDEVVGRDLVEGEGGRVELVPLLPEHSTTALVDRIRGRSDD